MQLILARPHKKEIWEIKSFVSVEYFKEIGKFGYSREESDQVVDQQFSANTCYEIYDTEKGFIGYFLFDLVGQTLQLGFLYIVPHHRRCGYGEAVIKKIMLSLPWKRIVSTIFVSNTASRKLHKKLGFRPVNVVCINDKP